MIKRWIVRGNQVASNRQECANGVFQTLSLMIPQMPSANAEPSVVGDHARIVTPPNDSIRGSPSRGKIRTIPNIPVRYGDRRAVQIQAAFPTMISKSMRTKISPIAHGPRRLSRLHRAIELPVQPISLGREQTC